jgi:DNA repair protein RadC
MASELFSEFERELIDSARLILSDGVRRLSERAALFPTNRHQGKAGRAEVTEARSALVDHLVATYGPLRHEVAVCCLIDAQGRLIAVEEFPQGKATHCEVSRRLMAEMIIKSGAVAIILAHNHPSGDNTPSRQDEQLTAELAAWLPPLECTLIDHLVLCTSGAASMLGEF